MTSFKLMRTGSRNLLESPGKTVDTAEPQNLRRLRYRHVEIDQKFPGPGNPAALMKSPWRYPISLAKKFAEVGDNLSKKLDSKVELSRNAKGHGKIVIPFKSDDDLERILSLIKN